MDIGNSLSYDRVLKVEELAWELKEALWDSILSDDTLEKQLSELYEKAHLMRQKYDKANYLRLR